MRQTPGSLSPSATKLRHLAGFVEAAVVIAGAENKPPRTAHGLAGLCQKIAASYPDSKGNADIVAVQKGRRTIGHRISDAHDVIAISHAIARRASLPITFHGPIVPRLASRAGLRAIRAKPLSKDPAADALMRAVLTDYSTSRTARFIEGQPGDGWHSALILPIARPVAVDLFKVILVVEPDCSIVRVVELPIPSDHAGFGFNEAGQEALRSVACQARIAGNETDFSTHEVKPGHEEVLAFIDHVAPALATPDRKRLLHAIRRHANIGNQASIAKFRRSLSEQVRSYAARLRWSFSSFGTTERFLVSRDGWGAEQYTRMNQAFTALKWLNPRQITATAVDLIVTGRPIEEVVRKACGLQAPLHHKTVKAALMMSGGRTIPATTLIGLLETLFRHDPHLPLPDKRELDALALIAKDFEYCLHAREIRPQILLPHRDEKGRFAYAGQGLHDVYEWLCRRLAELAPDQFRHSHVALDILFPAGRRVGALQAINQRWHASIAADTQAYKAAKDAIYLRHAVDRDIEEEEALEADLYPHPMTTAEVVDGITMRPLICDRDIVAEGAEMGHCVGTYGFPAACGRSFLIAISSGAGRSTAELSLRLHQESDDLCGEWKILVVQHKGPGNVEPPESHDKALLDLVASCNRRSLIELADRVEVAHISADILRQIREESVTAEGVAEIRDLEFGLLKSYLPNKWRRMGRQGMVAYLRQHYPRLPAELIAA